MRLISRSLVGWGGAPNGLIEKYTEQHAAPRRTPREQGGALGLRTERLVAGAHAHIADDFPRIARGS